VAPATPDGVTVTPGNQTLRVTWNAVAQATSYSVHYGIDSTAENTVANLSDTQVEIGGLQNGTAYRISVRAQSQAIVHAAVDATAGTESTRAHSNDVALALGTAQQSADSAEVTGIPEQVLPYPALRDEGCFIATAAYGYYTAPQVQALRDFRDRFLLTNGPGRAFVGWYYHTSPPVADLIRAHPAARTTVRVALYPVVQFAALATHAPWLAAALAVGFPLVSVAAVRYVRRRGALA
jgi:hypothetical protein